MQTHATAHSRAITSSRGIALSNLPEAMISAGMTMTIPEQDASTNQQMNFRLETFIMAKVCSNQRRVAIPLSPRERADGGTPPRGEGKRVGNHVASRVLNAPRAYASAKIGLRSNQSRDNEAVCWLRSSHL